MSVSPGIEYRAAPEQASHVPTLVQARRRRPGRGPWHSRVGPGAGGNTAVHSLGRGNTITPGRAVGAAGQARPLSPCPHRFSDAGR